MKFTIRDLLLVTVIVALAVGWCVDRARLALVIKSQDVELNAMRLNEELARAIAEAEAAQAAAVVKPSINFPPNSPALAPIPPKE